MTRLFWILALVLVVATWTASALVYSRLPAQVPIHWNIQGQVDGYGAKTWAAFLMPGVMVGLLGLFLLLPTLSPRNFEVDSFRATYLLVMVFLLALLAYIHGLMLYAATAHHVEVGRALVGGLFVFLTLLGGLMGRLRRNFYIGVRVPWTLANERVWNDTHRLAGWVFVLCGLAGCIITAAGLPLAAAFAVLFIGIAVPIVYSFVHYKRLERRGEV